MHPYKHIKNREHWFKKTENELVIPRFQIGKDEKIISAGSCFSRKIAGFLKKNNQYLITETLDPKTFNFLDDLKSYPHIYIMNDAYNKAYEIACEKYNYGIFSARYDNIYTFRQLLQLLERAYDIFKPKDHVWIRDDGKLVDAFRPRINPDGYLSEKEVVIDRNNHFKYVRQAFESADVFIYTVGLTEAWLSAEDGAVYPLCAGVDGGYYTSQDYLFKNFNVKEIIEDFTKFYNLIKSVNNKIKIILTVSPTPIMATITGNHIISANCYSKSALRAACHDIVNIFYDVDYFPSYDLVMYGSFNGINNFKEDCRTPSDDVIIKVMDVFFESYFTNRDIEEVVGNKIDESPVKTGIMDICDNILGEI